MNHTAMVNGIATRQIDVADRGLAYGDGVFRTLRCDGGRLQHWDRHFAKLQADCARLGLACPDEALWLADVQQLAPQDAVVKLTVTRGIGKRGYAADIAAPVTRITQTSTLPDYPATLAQSGVSVRICDWQLGSQPALAGIKHLNRLDQVMARREWNDNSIFEGLMCNSRGELVEGVISNLFLLRDGCLLTHHLYDCGVAGVTRQRVMDAANAMSLPVCQTALMPKDLHDADAAMLCNSLFGLLPIRICLASGHGPEKYWRENAAVNQLREAMEA